MNIYMTRFANWNDIKVVVLIISAMMMILTCLIVANSTLQKTSFTELAAGNCVVNRSSCANFIWVLLCVPLVLVLNHLLPALCLIIFFLIFTLILFVPFRTGWAIKPFCMSCLACSAFPVFSGHISSLATEYIMSIRFLTLFAPLVRTYAIFTLICQPIFISFSFIKAIFRLEVFTSRTFFHTNYCIPKTSFTQG